MQSLKLVQQLPHCCFLPVREFQSPVVPLVWWVKSIFFKALCFFHHLTCRAEWDGSNCRMNNAPRSISLLCNLQHRTHSATLCSFNNSFLKLFCSSRTFLLYNSSILKHLAFSVFFFLSKMKFLSKRLYASSSLTLHISPDLQFTIFFSFL